MKAKEVWTKINEMERYFGEDFYDLGGGSIGLGETIKNLEVLIFLKDNKPLIFKHICVGFEEYFKKDLEKMLTALTVKTERFHIN